MLAAAVIIFNTAAFFSLIPHKTTTATAPPPPPFSILSMASNTHAGTQIEPQQIRENIPKWPGWPGLSVYRLIVPTIKVGSIIGIKGENVKKLCHETGASVKVLDGPITSPHRVVLVSAKEEPEAVMPPAMLAVMRLSKQLNELPEGDEDDIKSSGAAAIAFCCVRLLMASAQAFTLIGKQWSTIKSIQETTGAVIRVLSSDEFPTYATLDEKVVEVQGECFKVIKALEYVVGHLRKFVVDPSVLPLFEKNHYGTPPTKNQQTENWADKTMMHPTAQAIIHSTIDLQRKQDTIFASLDSIFASLSGQGTGLSGISSLGCGPNFTEASSKNQHSENWADKTMLHPTTQPRIHSTIDLQRNQDSVSASLSGQGIDVSGISSLEHGPIIIEVSQKLQFPLMCAYYIIGADGSNISYIRRTSGAMLTVKNSIDLPDEITVEIKGTLSQVEAAQQLIQKCVNKHEVLPGSSGNTKPDSWSS